MVIEYHNPNFPSITDSTIERVKERIYFHKTAYRNGEGIVKIGYGTSKIRGKSIQLSSTCTKEEAEQWLRDDIIEAANTVKLTVNDSINQEQFDNLVYIAYRMGPAKFLGIADDANKDNPQAEGDEDEASDGHSETETI